MKSNEISEFTRVLSSVSSLYNKPMSKAWVALYWAALERFELAEVKRALQAHVNHPDCGQYLPKPADVVRFLQGDSRSQALQAWSRVLSAMRDVGSYTSVIFDDPVIHAVIQDMGGWVQLCQVREKELPFREQNFIARYVGFVNKPPTHYPKQLTGLLEHQNALQGYPLQAPVCVGDLQKALSVYEQGRASGQPYHALPRTALTSMAVVSTREGGAK